MLVPSGRSSFEAAPDGCIPKFAEPSSLLVMAACLLAFRPAYSFSEGVFDSTVQR
jgi:hypothetical protein